MKVLFVTPHVGRLGVRAQARVDALRAAGCDVVVQSPGGALLGHAFDSVSFDELDCLDGRTADWLAHLSTKVLPKA